jgi:hypothetical protein
VISIRTFSCSLFVHVEVCKAAGLLKLS